MKLLSDSLPKLKTKVLPSNNYEQKAENIYDRMYNHVLNEAKKLRDDYQVFILWFIGG